jgi:hypothetical protein
VRKLLAAALLALGVTRVLRSIRRRSTRRLRLNLYYADGALLSLPPTTPEATAALARATEALRAAARP